MPLQPQDIRSFFKLRIKELYHKDTLDSYRVRNHNVMTLLIELKSVASGWLENRVKRFETVKYCLEETIDALNGDSCLDYSFLSKELFVNDLVDYKCLISNDNQDEEKRKARAHTPSLLFLIDKCINHNKSKYLSVLLDRIEEKMFIEKDIDDKQFTPFLIDFDSLLTSFATELVHIGYSKVYLYKYFNSIHFGDNKEKDTLTFSKMRYKFQNHEKNQYYVIFKLQVSSELQQKEILSKYPEFVDKVPNKFMDAVFKMKTYLNSNPAVRFFIREVSALDSVSAIKEARLLLSSILDSRQTGDVQIRIEIPHTAFTFEKRDNNNLWSSYGNSLLIDSTNGGVDVDTQKVVDALSKIEIDDNVSKDVKDRIKFALRHLRIGDVQAEMEQRFINYWVALEFIFSSPSSSESTFLRMKLYLTKILTCCYAKRNMYRFNDWLVASKTINRNEKFWELMDMDERMDDKKILAKYRYKNLKSSMLTHSDKRKVYVGHHKKNIERHLSRLYRLRNELIHEAGAKEDIECSTSHLRYYLVFLLNQIIVYFSHNEDDQIIRNINDFFYDFECVERKLAVDWNLDGLLSVNMAENLLA